SLIAIAPYDVEALRRAFAEAEASGWFIEAVFLEPVMGEGDPGRALPRAFYDAARELTTAHGSLLLVDSIQAGLRAHGVLSIVDYPGFEGIDAPDLETYSKALNAGQYPLSVLAATAHAAGLYRTGVYGNTMTTNPRALDVACVVLETLPAAARKHPRTRPRGGGQARSPEGRTRRTDHRGPGHRPAVLLRTGAAVQVLRRRLDRGVAARARHRRDPRRRQLAALHP